MQLLLAGILVTLSTPVAIVGAIETIKEMCHELASMRYLVRADLRGGWRSGVLPG